MSIENILLIFIAVWVLSGVISWILAAHYDIKNGAGLSLDKVFYIILFCLVGIVGLVLSLFELGYIKPFHEIYLVKPSKKTKKNNFNNFLTFLFHPLI